MFNKNQRFVLGKLSETIWASETRWQKYYNNCQLDIVETSEIEEEVKQIQLNNSKNGKGTILNKWTAQKKNLWDAPDTIKVQKHVGRKPTFDELVASLTDLARAALYSHMNPSSLVSALAVDLVSNLNVELELVRKEGDEADYESLLSKLPENLQEKVKNFKGGMKVDAIEFVSELLFAVAHKDEALSIYNDNLDAARTSHKRYHRQQYAKTALGL